MVAIGDDQQRRAGKEHDHAADAEPCRGAGKGNCRNVGGHVDDMSAVVDNRYGDFDILGLFRFAPVAETERAP